MAYIQVGGKADSAADAAPSPSALRASGAEAKRTPERINRTKPNESAAAAEPSPLNRLGIGCRFPAAHGFLFTGFIVAVSYRSPAFRYEHFGSSFITSGLTCPMYSPSIQQEKLSKRSIFLSSKP